MSANKVATLQPTVEHTHTVIFLHGRGSTAAEFLEELFESQASDHRTLPEIFPQIRWAFPTSGILPSKSFGDMSQWYEMLSTDNPSEGECEHQHDIEAAVSRILDVIQQESAVLGDCRKVILAGISQGCAIAVQALVKQESRLGGFIGLSSWLPWSLRSLDASQDTEHTPVFLSHSEDDSVIDIEYGRRLRHDLEKGFKVEWRQYADGGHWINEPQGIDDMVVFLKRVMEKKL